MVNFTHHPPLILPSHPWQPLQPAVRNLPTLALSPQDIDEVVLLQLLPAGAGSPGRELQVFSLPDYTLAEVQNTVHEVSSRLEVSVICNDIPANALFIRHELFS